MWNNTWRYAEGWTIGIGLFMTGIILQLTVGKVDTAFVQYPVNLIFGGGYLIILILLHFLGRIKTPLRWFSGLEASITSLLSLLVMVILMGLTGQVAPSENLSSGGLAWLGFMQMTSSWPFILLFLYFLSVLGLVTLRKISSFRWKDIPFFLNHAGLFITLWAAILGSEDLHRLRMTVSKDAVEWRAIDENNELTELPLAIELKSFVIEEYPPKLMLIDNITGKALPEKQPVNFLVEEAPCSGSLLDWEVEVSNYLPMAACVANADTVNFVGFNSEGATSALYVKARNKHSGAMHEGWISSGNYMFPYVTLPLDENMVMVMPEREPKRFVSDVIVYKEKDKQKVEAQIEVNKPLNVAGWNIYQLSYDETMGKWSNSSVFELVRDPWLPIVYTGIFLMLAGAVCLFVQAPKKGRVE